MMKQVDGDEQVRKSREQVPCNKMINDRLDILSFEAEGRESVSQIQ